MPYTHLSDIFSLWGISETPYFGDLARKPEKIKPLFKFRNNLIEAIQDRLTHQLDSKIILLAGHPGVGKSTILEYLSLYTFPNRFKRISMISRLGVVDWGFSEFTEEQFVYVFEEVERFLNEIINTNKLEYIPTIESGIRKKYSDGLGTNIPIKEFTRDILLPKCEIINQHQGEIPQYFLAIDDVDYLYPYHQKDFLSVLASIAQTTLNPLIIYSARPVAAGIAKTHITSYYNHLFAPPIEVEAIEPSAVIESRLLDVVEKSKSLINPLGQTDVKTIVNDMCNNKNLREALNIAEFCVLNAYQFTKTQDFRYDRESIIKALFGPKSTSKDDSKDVEFNRRLTNIFLSFELEDVVPYIFVALFSLQKPKWIEKDYYDFFNEIANSLIPGTDFVPKISENQILKILIRCHKQYLVRRIEHIDFDDLPRDAGNYNPINRIKNHKLSLTDKGAFILKLSKDLLYQDISSFRAWKTNIQSAIINLPMNIVIPNISSMLSINNFRKEEHE